MFLLSIRICKVDLYYIKIKNLLQYFRSVSRPFAFSFRILWSLFIL